MSTAVWIAATVLVVAIVCYVVLWFGVDGNGEFFFMWICTGLAAISLTTLVFLGMFVMLIDSKSNQQKMESFVEWVTGRPLPEPTP